MAPTRSDDSQSDTSTSVDTSTTAVSWRCPLHWLQMYHDDGTKHHARTPCPYRNQARFHHITSMNPDPAQQYAYAHPSVPDSVKVRNALACVRSEDECHSHDLLQDTVDGLLTQQETWKMVLYYRAQAQKQCTRVLDWPRESLPRARPSSTEFILVKK